MRTFMKVSCEVKASNKALKDGSLQKAVEQAMKLTNPECAYFLTLDGLRTMVMVFDMKDPSQIPSIAEPFFLLLNAKVEFHPAMNAEDLQKGIVAAFAMEETMANTN